MKLLLSILSAVLFASSCFAQQSPNLDGAWIAKFSSESGEPREAKVSFQGDQGTWRTITLPNPGNPCAGIEVPLAIIAMNGDVLKLAMNPSSAKAECTDSIVSLKKADEKTYSGAFRDGRPFVLARPTPRELTPMTSTTAGAAAVEASPRFQLGDRWTYRMKTDGGEQYDYNEFVSALQGDMAEFLTSDTNGRWSLATYDALSHRYLIRYALRGSRPRPRGNVLTDYSENLAPIKFPFEIGNEWPVVFQYGSDRISLRGKVKGRETLTVPAGRFETYKIELSGLYHSNDAVGLALVGRWIETYWYAPQVKRYVRRETIKYGISLAKMSSTPVFQRVDELVVFQLQEP